MEANESRRPNLVDLFSDEELRALTRHLADNRFPIALPMDYQIMLMIMAHCHGPSSKTDQAQAIIVESLKRDVEKYWADLERNASLYGVTVADVMRHAIASGMSKSKLPEFSPVVWQKDEETGLLKKVEE